MYRIEVQSASSEPFSGLGEAQEAHIALTQQVEGLCASLAAPENDLRALASQYSDAGSGGDVRETALAELREIARFRRAIRAFEWRLAATGKVIADPQQRSLAQSLLDYWALRHVELRDRAAQFSQLVEGRVRPVSRRPVSPRTLVPVDERLAKSLTETAEETYAALDTDARRDAARDLFLSIATPYGRSWVIDPEVAARFTAAGVIVASGGGEAVRYTLAHDSVASQWERMVAWMKECRDEDMQFERVLANARNWDAHNNRDLLPRGEALKQAARFTDRDPVIAGFVENAQRAAEEAAKAAEGEAAAKLRLKRVGIPVVSILGLIAVFAITDRLFLHDEGTTSAIDIAKSSDTASEVRVAQAETAPQKNAACPAGGDASGWIWIGSPGNSQVFDATGTVIEPDKVDEKSTLLTRAWINLRAGTPTDVDGDSKSARALGTVSARSVAAVIDKPWSHSTDEGMQYWVKVSLPTSVYLQVPDPSEPRIAGLVSALKGAGLVTPPVQRLEMPPGLNEVRYYYRQDAARAEQVACLANQVLDPTGPNRIEVRSLADTSLAAKVSNGTIELWVYPRGGGNAQSPAERPTARPGRDRGGQTAGANR